MALEAKPVTSTIRIIPHFKCGMEGLFNLSQQHLHSTGKEHSLDNKIYFDSKPCKIFISSSSNSSFTSSSSSQSPSISNSKQDQISVHDKDAPPKLKFPEDEEHQQSTINSISNENQSKTTTNENLASLTHYSPQHLIAVTQDSVTCTLLHLSKKSIADTDLKRPQQKHRFKSKITCSDLSGGPNPEIVLGFASGDCLIHDPLQTITSKLLLQFNKDNIISNGSVVAIRWHPRFRNKFLACFSDGFAVMFDKTKKDIPLVSAERLNGNGPQQDSSPSLKSTKQQRGGVDQFSSPSSPPFISHKLSAIVTHFPKSEAHNNPQSRWCLTTPDVTVHAMEFSETGKSLAVACSNGLLKIFDVEKEQLICSFRSYYGGFLCCSWIRSLPEFSDDLIVTGGEDDSICVYSVKTRTQLFRGEGHQAHCSRVQFDLFGSASKQLTLSSLLGESNITVGNQSRKTIGLVSVGDDGKILIWKMDLFPDDDNNSTTKQQQQKSTSLASSLLTHEYQSMNEVLIVPAKQRKELTISKPISSHFAHAEPISDLSVCEDFIVTIDLTAISRVWIRPPKPTNSNPTTPTNDNLNQQQEK